MPLPSDILSRLERAKTLTEALKEDIQRFFASNPYEAVAETDVNGHITVKARVRAEAPSDWSLQVGEIIHHLRSCLDMLVWHLVAENGSTPTTQTAFPIANDAADYAKQANTRLLGISTKNRGAIDGLTPYGGGDDQLWKLHKLDIVDKHRKLLVAGSALQAVVIDGADMFRKMSPDMDIPAMPIALRPATREFPLKDGETLYGDASGSGLPLPRFSFEIAYSDGEGIIEPEPLIESLEGFTKKVEAILTAF